MRTRNLGFEKSKRGDCDETSQHNSLQQERKKEFDPINLPLHEWSDDDDKHKELTSQSPLQTFPEVHNIILD